MLFNSYTFAVFFLIVVAVYWRLEHRWQNAALVIASFIFYGAWDWRFLSLIGISIIVNFVAAGAIERSDSTRRRKALLLLAVCVNFGLLGFFKYFSFFVTEAIHLLELFGFAASAPSLKVILPVGISFYTFQAMSYTIDVYRGKARATRNLIDFALFVCFFPQLVAGPIERYSRLMPQIRNPRVGGADCFATGLYHVLMGLFKKIIIADNMAPLVSTVFAADPGSVGGGTCLLGVYAFAFQIYGDFSGYSSIARGVAKWLGFDLMLNFRMPYFSTSPREFWHRWHISLSSWLRDYLYIPLGGSRRGPSRTHRNLMLTMFLGGLWHGAGWTFIAWGGYHGALLSAQRLFGRHGRREQPHRGTVWLRVLCVLIMFHLTCIGWLLFRSDSITHAWRMFIEIVSGFSADQFTSFLGGMILFFVAPLMLFEYWLHCKDAPLWLLTAPWPLRSAVYTYLVLMLWFFHPGAQHEFIYFQF